jgi:hypothetical protein
MSPQTVSPFFLGFTMLEADKLSEYMTVMKPRPDQQIIRYKRKPECLFVVCRGALIVKRGVEEVRGGGCYLNVP